MMDFSKIYKEDIDIVGKKAVELAELARLKIPIPDGFVITASFFKKFLRQTGIAEEILEIQKINHPAIKDSIDKLFTTIQKDIIHASMPEDLKAEIYRSYKKLYRIFKEPSLNIFSSSFLNDKCVMFKNVKGDANLILKIKEIWTFYINKPVAIVVQKNINSKVKGEIFTNDLSINENLFTDTQINQLTKFCRKIQRHFYFPKVLDYAVEKGKIYITHVKPFTGRVNKTPKVILQKRYAYNVLIKGSAINPGIATGPARILNQTLNFDQIKKDEIIVFPKLDISLYKNLKNAKAIIIDSVISASYDKMLYRKDVRVPTVAGTKNAAKILRNGNIITVNGITGEIYSGGLI